MRKRERVVRLNTPAFENEAEEAEWYAKNQDRLLDAFKSAYAKKGVTPTTTIRLDQEDIEMARRQAEELGMRYQTFLKMLIRQALRSRVILVKR